MRQKKSVLKRDPRVQAFAAAAISYCKLIEERSRFNKRRFVHRCTEVLADLLAKYIPLLDVKVAKGTHLPTEGRIKHEQWRSLFRSLSKKLGSSNAYYEVFDPFHPERDDPIQTALADDLADIYRDLRKGLEFYGRRDELNQQRGIYAWRLQMGIHSLHHCGNAMRALCALIEKDHESDCP